MLIGEISKRTGFSRDTIRYYEKLGVLTPTSRRESKYREYSEESVFTLLVIKKLKSVGFTLKEIDGWLDLFRNESYTCETVAVKATAKIREVEQKIAELNQIKTTLGRVLDMCEGDSTEALCPSFERLWQA